MRLVLRLLGTWLIGLAVVLVVVDGTRTLAAGEVFITPLEATWAGLSPASLEAVRAFFATRFFGAVLGPAVDVVLGWPGWAVVGVPGIVLAFFGRSPAKRLKEFTQI